MVPILSFPSVRGRDLNEENMNWTCVVYGGPMGLILIWWAVSARKWFKGPKGNLEHLMHGREGGEHQVIEGKDVSGDQSSASNQDDLAGSLPGKRGGEVKEAGL